MPHCVGDHRQVLGQGGAQCLLDMPVVALGHDARDGRSRVPDGRRHWVIGGFHTDPSGEAESHQLGIPQPQSSVIHGGEERSVVRIGARPTALDEPDAQLVEQRRNRELVRHGEVETLLLRTVAQRGVEDMKLGGFRP